LIPGDRVEGLGNFGKPTGGLGTVERATEDDAVVKWDDDGRMRLAQPSLKKILSVTSWADLASLEAHPASFRDLL
jgi:hypothetical protein